ncbi:hypothetical protein A2U01_0106466, partial [Trifolium medium]|nr:hypothetical protein [Trifolium medium]
MKYIECRYAGKGLRFDPLREVVYGDYQ